MDWFEGVLLVPPERGQILGRASWKSRYVVVGKRSAIKDHRNNPNNSHCGTNSRNNSNSSKALSRAPTDEYCISVYKSKEDIEPIQHWPMNFVSDCQVQMLAHRKQGPVLPTLVVTMSDKDRKRRSSRAAGLISTNKESGAMTLWFRTPSDDKHTSLHEWARFISSKKGYSNSESPVSPTFTSPFATSRSREHSDYLFSHSGSGIPGNRSEGRLLHHKSSTATYSTGPRGERHINFSSESPSLRSRRSDVSSPSSTNYPIQKMPHHVPGQHYTTVHPTEMISPGTIIEHQGQLIEGWTTAQGRAHAMASPVHGANSGSKRPSISDACAPPAPGETILDRAFQLGHIPGMQSDTPGEEKLSSIARFDALMRDADERLKRRAAAERAEQAVMRSAFEADDSSDEEESQDSDDCDSGSDYPRGLHQQSRATLITPTAQRALEFIAGRHEAPRNVSSNRPVISRAHLSFQADAAMTSEQANLPRPHTAHSKGRLNLSQRTQSTPQLAPIPVPSTLDIPLPPGRPIDDGSRRPNGGEKRHSSSSARRLSFTEFTKRLSSTSSLLLVQTNASGGSSRGSSEIDFQPSAPRTNLTLRGAIPPPRNRDRDERGRACGWRSGVGVVGSEGGFV